MDMTTISPEDRLKSFHQAVEELDFTRLIGAHDGLSALCAERSNILKGDHSVEFDGIWVSGLATSASKGLPDAELIGHDTLYRVVDEVATVTTKPLLVDGDTGGSGAQFENLVKRLERLGVSGIQIEDKKVPKRWSRDQSAQHEQIDPELFAKKIQRGIDVKSHDEFMIIARIESLTVGKDMDDALQRAAVYIDAGASAIIVLAEKLEDVIEFAERYEELCDELGTRPFLKAAPSSYNIRDEELAAYGHDIIAHGSHLMRAAHNAMNATARSILEHGGNEEVEADISTSAEVMDAVGFDRVKERDQIYGV